ncbi:MAG: Lipopolysaccharide export system protein LptA precursor [Pseudomonadota bacterium]
MPSPQTPGPWRTDRGFANRSWQALGLALALALPHAPALAEKADREKPMQIESDQLKHDEQRKLTVFTGKVIALKGTIVMRADRVEVQQNDKGQQVTQLFAAAGERIFYRQKREGLNEFIEGEAVRAVYDEPRDLLTLYERAEMRILRSNQQVDVVQGQTIVYHQQTEQMQVDGRTPGSGNAAPRVRAVINPKAQDAAPAPAPDLRLQTAPAGKRP